MRKKAKVQSRCHRNQSGPNLTFLSRAMSIFCVAPFAHFIVVVVVVVVVVVAVDIVVVRSLHSVLKAKPVIEIFFRQIFLTEFFSQH